jgi:L-cysteine:1D-myo-inositol 2-amino-2-deoxy-alpha-D-glucopyranoside ligase
MAGRYLGQPVTIHGGGSDLIFPHHESERAQSESLNPAEPFVRYWVHVGMLRYQGEKMSKSLGNLVLVGDLLERHSPDAIRLALLSRHYRESWEYEEALMAEAQTRADRLAEAAAAPPNADGENRLRAEEFAQDVVAALDDDLDTPAAIEILDELAREIERDSLSGINVAAAQAILRETGGVLGLTLGRVAAPQPGPEPLISPGFTMPS